MSSFNKKALKQVNFLIAGVQKGGTTTLDYYLRQHSQVCMAIRKEVHFFDNERIFNKKQKPDYNFYHSFFKPTDQNQLLGESTPIYSYWKKSPKRIYNYNQNMKFIILLRNPIDRAYSHWNKETMNFHSNKNNKAVETLPFFEAIKTETQRCINTKPLQHRYYSYIDRGFYTEQLNRLNNYFPCNQILVLKSEWLLNKTEETLEQVYNFLGIDIQPLPEITLNTITNQTTKTVSPVESPDLNPVNLGRYERSISEQEKQFLIKRFTDEISKLEVMLNWDCSDWLI